MFARRTKPSLGEAYASTFAPASLGGFATGIARWELASGSPSEQVLAVNFPKSGSVRYLLRWVLA